MNEDEKAARIYEARQHMDPTTREVLDLIVAHKPGRKNPKKCACGFVGAWTPHWEAVCGEHFKDRLDLDEG